jgi:uncharacterized protein YodC (DUF2158 family)
LFDDIHALFGLFAVRLNGLKQAEKEERRMELKDFKPGDLVQVKSGGPVMTVEKSGTSATFGEDFVSCVWFEKVGNKQVAQDRSFTPAVLDKVEKPHTSASVGILRA